MHRSMILQRSQYQDQGRWPLRRRWQRSRTKEWQKEWHVDKVLCTVVSVCKSLQHQFKRRSHKILTERMLVLLVDDREDASLIYPVDHQARHHAQARMQYKHTHTKSVSLLFLFRPSMTMLKIAPALQSADRCNPCGSMRACFRSSETSLQVPLPFTPHFHAAMQGTSPGAANGT